MGIIGIIVGITVIMVGITIIIATTVDLRAVLAGPLAKRDGRKNQQAPDRRLFRFCNQSVFERSGYRSRKENASEHQNKRLGRCRAQLQFLNFQDLSFHGVSVSTRHCSHRSGGQ
jgi:hypothetical protein